jgi:hypothetical protein
MLETFDISDVKVNAIVLMYNQMTNHRTDYWHLGLAVLKLTFGQVNAAELTN